MKKIMFASIFIMVGNVSLAQTETTQYATVKGKVVFKPENSSASNVAISIPRLKILSATNDSGMFVFDDIKYGYHQIIIESSYGNYDTLKINVDQQIIDLGIIAIAKPEGDIGSMTKDLTDVSIDDLNFSVDDNEQQFIPAIASQNLYNNSILKLSALNFSTRGYSSDQTEVYANGLLLNDVESGVPLFPSGLYDAMHINESFVGLRPSHKGGGKLNGCQILDLVAAHQEQQSIISYTQANKSYSNRILFAHHTGLMANGWALSLAGSRSWAREGYVDGTFNNSYSYYLGVSKQLGNKSMLHFYTTANKGMGAKSTPATQEACDLAGTNFYNPAWGFQNGAMRSSNVAKTYLPMYTLQYEYNPDHKTNFDLTMAYQCGYSEQSGLDWYTAADPRPDYYKKMPSFYINDPATANAEQAESIRQKWLNDPGVRQINWDQLYEANKMNFENIHGIEGRRAAYVLGADRADSRKYMFAFSFQRKMDERLKIAAGMNFMLQQTEHYRKMSDLLGGDYYVDLNQFAEQTYPGNPSMKQIDLNNPDRLVRVGDKYGYDYSSGYVKSFAHTMLTYAIPHFDFFVAGKIGYDQFNREGHYRNGLFPDSSFGRSAAPAFITWQLKAGITWKINGFQNVYFNTALMSQAPSMDDIFISPKTRNSIATQPAVEKIRSLEAGYAIHRSKWSGSLSVFASDINDATRIRRFYYEGDNTFVNYLMQNIDVRHQGIELALQMKLSSTISASAAATWMQVFYNADPIGSLYRDNDTSTSVKQHITYLKNYNLASGPQSAYTLGFQYYSRRWLNAGISFNYLDRNYVDVNPLRHTVEAIDMLPEGSAQQQLVLRQEKLPSAFTIDISLGKTIFLSKIIKWLPGKTFVQISGGVSNILNRKDIRTSGYDQLRFDYETKNPDLFPTKYTYGYGANYFVKCKVGW